ncbi:hypothetical protein CC2G_014471 [Coprinopsis cinerea AmutBmut pab1-1]|nr:hypothetical protein CC2G_014471 [Coprinopsis cinerea AmutBmut pab1-1]
MEGFEEFMKPLEFGRLRQAACNGPVVILIAHERGCDALALQASTGLIHIPLSKISYRKVVMLGDAIQSIVGGGSVCSRNYGREEEEKLEGLYRDVRKILPGSSRITGLRGSQYQRFETVLGVLWTSIVHPILEALDLKNKTENPPRMWWLPSGPFIRLPIHAAGLYTGSQPTCLSDFVTPSYCTNLSDLLPQRSEPVENSAPRVLAVMQEEVPGHPHLKLAKIPAELESLQNSISEARMEFRSSTSSPSEANVSRLDLIVQVGTSESPTSPTAVLEELHRGVDIALFGCHGVQNLENPLESHLMLSGGKLTMTDLFQVRAEGSTGARDRLAYLSACDTARGDVEQPDQAMHLVGTMMFAGFSSVVGTMWQMADEDAPLMAETFYRHMFGKEGRYSEGEALKMGGGGCRKLDVRDSAEALQMAVKELRKRGRSYKRWVPFVHFGL